MKSILTLFLLAFLSCKTAFVSDYSFPASLEAPSCYYEIKIDNDSFSELMPITSSSSESFMLDGKWVSIDHDDVVGYGVHNESYDAFTYLIEEGINQNTTRETCGHIHVTRIEHEKNNEFIQIFSLLTLFIPNIFGVPVRLIKAKNTFLFEVYNTDDVLIYRNKHTGSGSASMGFYYGFNNPDDKAEFEATHAAIQDFLTSFEKR